MKRTKLDVDALSDLPLSITKTIVKLLPIQDAIRTRILSSEWRYRWSYIDCLVFDGRTMFPGRFGGTVFEKRMKDFVTRTLYLHQGPIHKFEIYALKGIRSCLVTDQWFLFLLKREIREFRVRFFHVERGRFRVPSYLYSYRNLTVLKLQGCQLSPMPPAFKGFKYLTTFTLTSFDDPYNTVETIVASSPLLHFFSFKELLFSKPVFRITALHLKRVLVYGSFQEIHLCAPLLTKMSIRLSTADFKAEELGQKNVCNYTSFLGGFPLLEHLDGAQYLTKYLSIGIEYCPYPLVFHHLKDITLTEVNWENMDEILVVVRLIMDAAANLCEFRISFIRFPFIGEDSSKAPHINYWDSESPQNCTFVALKQIQIRGFTGAPHEMKFINFLLKSSAVLETMTIYQQTYWSNVEKLTIPEETKNTLAELLDCPRASSNANITFNV